MGRKKWQCIGVVAKEEDFFKKAFGENVDEYNEILTMPREFVVYRHYFESTGLTTMWRFEYSKINKIGKIGMLHSLLSDNIRENEDPDIIKIMVYYKINYKSLRKKFGDVIPVAREILNGLAVFE